VRQAEKPASPRQNPSDLTNGISASAACFITRRSTVQLLPAQPPNGIGSEGFRPVSASRETAFEALVAFDGGLIQPVALAAAVVRQQMRVQGQVERPDLVPELSAYVEHSITSCKSIDA
jgi:hypothetical protein